ncbi:MAG: MobA/MobL family protein [Rickettsiaceae bacterium]|nr:MobA/MobL family protein [Rickettsiaceae bacterium]
MAIFSMHVSEVQRSKGQSAVAASAYISRSKLSLYKNYSSKNKKNITTYSYINRNDIGYSKIFAPTSAPDWVYDREKLWNRCEEVEKRINSQTARKIMVALPIELTAEQNIELIKEFILKYLIPEGMIVDINIHNDPQNPHAHLQLTIRAI